MDPLINTYSAPKIANKCSIGKGNNAPLVVLVQSCYL